MSANTQHGGRRRPLVMSLKTGRPSFVFDRRVILTSAAAATAIPIINNDEIPDGFRVYIQGITFRVSGATAWGTTATVVVRTKASSPTTLVTVAVADLAANNFFFMPALDGTLTATSVFSAEAEKGEFADSGYGIEVVGDANGTGSDLYVRVWGVVEPPQLTTANWGVSGSPGGGGSGGNDELIRG